MDDEERDLVDVDTVRNLRLAMLYQLLLFSVRLLGELEKDTT